MTITREESKAIWDMVVANHDKLESCPGPHVFQNITPEKKIGKRYRCTMCGGEAEQLNVSWYNKGLGHASARRPIPTLPEIKTP